MKTVKKENVTFRMDLELREFLESIAKEERRSFSNQLNVALEEWIRVKNELHPQFIKDIKEALKSGKPEPVWKG
ncbi:MAG: hypothetical protein ISS45_02670 [Candidatus Omnitrophica bacterium]|nr:hypothetical protein [Candidatus Omnitrophota bacterium]